MRLSADTSRQADVNSALPRTMQGYCRTGSRGLLAALGHLERLKPVRSVWLIEDRVHCIAKLFEKIENILDLQCDIDLAIENSRQATTNTSHHLRNASTPQ